MIRSYALTGGKLVAAVPEAAATPGAIWHDLFTPEREEELAVGQLLGIVLPTREDRAEIEVSSRLYVEDGALFMTVLIPTRTEETRSVMAPVTFILGQGSVVTIRDHDPRAFGTFVRRIERNGIECSDGVATLLSLLDEIVDRIADVLENIGREIDTLSRGVFDEDGRSARKGDRYLTVLKEIGRKGDLASNLRDSLLTLERMASFLAGHARSRPDLKAHRDEIRALGTDTRALSDHADFLGQKLNFLLDATLGLIQIEQNATIKIFSVVAVVFLPPTLVASMYGMNFEYMPELAWPWGYPFAIGMMILSAILPYLFFKRQGWL